MKSWILVSMLAVYFGNGINCQNSKDKKKNFELHGFTFYSSPCFGTCPSFTMSLDENRQIQLVRQVYKGKGQADSAKSGSFKGSLTEADHNKIIDLLRKVDWDTLKFPEIYCCDGPVVTIMIEYNKESKTFRSMTPPQETEELIAYLKDFLLKISYLPEYDKPMDFKIPDLPPAKGQ